MSSSSASNISNRKVANVSRATASFRISGGDLDDGRLNQINRPPKQQKRKRSSSKDSIDSKFNDRQKTKYELRSCGKVDRDDAGSQSSKKTCQRRDNDQRAIINNPNKSRHVKVENDGNKTQKNSHPNARTFSLKQNNNIALESCSNDERVGSSVYHEPQQQQLCGLHALNAVLQGPYFVKEDLFAIARQIDDETRALLQQIGPSAESCNNFEKNSNEKGNLSLQVLQIALGRYNIEMVHHQSDRPIAIHFRNGTLIPDAFICNLRGQRGNHWAAVRKIGNHFYNLDSSARNGPRIIDSFDANDCFILSGNLP